MGATATGRRRWSARRVLAAAAPWVPAILLALLFARAGLAKFSDQSGWARAFAHWGFPVWFRVLIGALEVGAALLVLVPARLAPRAAPAGALVIVAVMLGAMATHVVRDGGRHLTSEVVPLVLASLLLYARRAALTTGRPTATSART
jgi:putative oxidoreductase